MTTVPEVTLEAVNSRDATMLTNLFELYLHDMSEFFSGVKVNADGRFAYDQLPHYWSGSETRFGYMIRAAGEIAGFALVGRGSPASDDPTVLDLNEFFVLRYQRRAQIGRRAAFQLWDRHRGQWIVRVSERNRPAQPFWESAVRDYTRASYETRPFQGKTHMFRLFSFRNL